MTLEEIKQVLTKLLAQLISMRNVPIPPHVDTPIVTPPPTEDLSLAQITQLHDARWCGGTVEERRAMMMLKNKVCKEEGLSLSLAADLHATVWGESGWNQWCQNMTTKDYGLCQFSQRYYLVEYGMTPVEALQSPEQCLRIMARNFKAGRQKNWIAYQPNNPLWIANRTRGL